MQKRWEINLDGVEHVVVYQGNKFSGEFKVLIDGVYNEYVPSMIRKVGLFAKLTVGEKEALLKVDLNGKSAYLAIDGVYVDDNTPVTDEAASIGRPLGQSELLQRKIKKYQGYFLSLVIFTYVNLALLTVNASISFPFSAIVPQIVLIFGKLEYDVTGILFVYVLSVIFSLIFASVYLLLYALSRRYIVPVWIALILIILDTCVVIFVGYNNISEVLIDLLFHCWIIWSLVQLLIARKTLERDLKNELASLNTTDLKEG